jgi:hypothetical protein
LVVQEALCSSRKSPEEHLRRIEARTAGVCFLGTPHHGSDVAKWGSTLVNVVKLVKPVNDEVVNLLNRGSKPLQKMQDDFKILREERKQEENKMGITCFYEQLPVVRSAIVPQDSAIMDGELYYPIHANHMVRKYCLAQARWLLTCKRIWSGSQDLTTRDTEILFGNFRE